MRVGVAGRAGAVTVAVVGLCAAFAVGTADAASWLPHASNATWTYQWTDSTYNATPTDELVTVKSSLGTSFTLAWTTDGANNPDGTPKGAGTMSFNQTTSGVVNTDWSSTPPPSGFPILCATVASCANSLAGSLYNLIWGTRLPVLAEPLLRGTVWSSAGGTAYDVTSSNTYVGTEQVTVPAFSKPVTASVVRSQITQSGALGDPYGSGVRTIWWVYGVGPVKIVFQHSGGSGSPVTTVVLQATNQTASPPPPDANYFPLKLGASGTFRWTNTKHLTKPEIESWVIDQAGNGSAIVKVQSISGQMKVSSAYEFTSGLDGVTNVASATRAASLATFPPLGPSSLRASKRRHFFTPFDLMQFGFDPVMPAYPMPGMTWASDPSSRDFALYGVTGSSRVVGMETVKVPAGTFRALVVSSVLRQPGFPFGSGTRTSWFAPGRGLVKLVFRHGDGSVSTVELLR